MADPTEEEIASLASKDSTWKRAQGLARRAKWARVGADERVLWGAAKGSGASNYDVRIRLEDRAPSCSCPAARRERYCKHLLGLMLYRARSASDFVAEVPDDVAAWLATKEEAAARKAEREAAKVAKAAARAEREAAGLPATAEEQAEDAKREAARAKRKAQAEARVDAGVKALELWLRDVVRDGIARLELQADSFFEDQARALVDAQASGLARRVRGLAYLPGSRPDWTEVMLDRLGRLALLVDAYGRRDTLPEPLRADLRRAVGWKSRKEEVLAGPDKLTDRWLMIGRRREVDEQLVSERAWLVGTTTGRQALIAQYAPAMANMGFEHRFALGRTFEADLVFHPSAAPLRAAIAARRGNEEDWSGDLPGSEHDVDAFLDTQARWLARVPWLWNLPCALRGVVVCPGDGWWVRDRKGRGLPLAAGEHWKLLSVTGGEAATLVGEWDGVRLRPLAAVVEGRLVDVGGAS